MSQQKRTAETTTRRWRGAQLNYLIFHAHQHSPPVCALSSIDLSLELLLKTFHSRVRRRRFKFQMIRLLQMLFVCPALFILEFESSFHRKFVLKMEKKNTKLPRARNSAYLDSSKKLQLDGDGGKFDSIWDLHCFTSLRTRDNRPKTAAHEEEKKTWESIQIMYIHCLQKRIANFFIHSRVLKMRMEWVGKEKTQQWKMSSRGGSRTSVPWRREEAILIFFNNFSFLLSPCLLLLVARHKRCFLAHVGSWKNSDRIFYPSSTLWMRLCSSLVVWDEIWHFRDISWI